LDAEAEIFTARNDFQNKIETKIGHQRQAQYNAQLPFSPRGSVAVKFYLSRAGLGERVVLQRHRFHKGGLVKLSF